ncbi:MAG: hypothetical protein MZV63_13410 [Marinilabiliales bacterium]|nr:hypothetical protein [Marinilabiliales bacterium]
MRSDLIAAMARAFDDYAAMLEARNESAAAGALRERAAALRKSYEGWWSEATGQYADGRVQGGALVFQDLIWNGVFPLYFGFVPPGPRRDTTLRRISGRRARGHRDRVLSARDPLPLRRGRGGLRPDPGPRRPGQGTPRIPRGPFRRRRGGRDRAHGRPGRTPGRGPSRRVPRCTAATPWAALKRPAGLRRPGRCPPRREAEDDAEPSLGRGSGLAGRFRGSMGRTRGRRRQRRKRDSYGTDEAGRPDLLGRSHDVRRQDSRPSPRRERDSGKGRKRSRADEMNRPVADGSEGASSLFCFSRRLRRVPSACRGQRRTSPAVPHGRWTAEKAGDWAASQPWTLGCNYIPRTAINTLEMWQADTFDPAVIDQELGWAEDLGFNAVRVFTHYLLWVQDPGGFLRRLDRFLGDRRPASHRDHVRPLRRLLEQRSSPSARSRRRGRASTTRAGSSAPVRSCSRARSAGASSKTTPGASSASSAATAASWPGTSTTSPGIPDYGSRSRCRFSGASSPGPARPAPSQPLTVGIWDEIEGDGRAQPLPGRALRRHLVPLLSDASRRREARGRRSRPTAGRSSARNTWPGRPAAGSRTSCPSSSGRTSGP